MSTDIPDTVETSLNLGIMELTEKELTLRLSIRSSVSSAKEALAEKIELLIKTLGGHTEFQGDYPAWPYACLLYTSCLRHAAGNSLLNRDWHIC